MGAWSQDDLKAEISIDHSYARFAAIDFATTHYEFYRAYDLNGGGGRIRRAGDLWWVARRSPGMRTWHRLEPSAGREIRER